jgi:murein DD-endopeptidase MepM/ murein hydrolase activator NlpD
MMDAHFCALEQVMFAVLFYSVKNRVFSFRWSAVISVVVATWLVACSVMMLQNRLRSSDSLSSTLSVDQLPEFLKISEKSRPFGAIISGRTDPAAVEVADASGTYLRTLTRLYDTSVLEQPQAFDEPLPQDEVSKFHEMETHAPVMLARISSEFGERPNPLGKGHVFHRGIDLAAPAGAPVYAVAEGTVVRATTEKTYGKLVVINHHNGYSTLYAHNSQLMVKVGERVKVGQQIAKVGSTGRSTGPHLHFEIHRDGERVDPAPYLAALLVMPPGSPQNNKAARG